MKRKIAIRQIQEKAAVAMSGGVDSGVSAALLVKAGYEVTGFHLQLFEKDAGWESAQKTAEFLKIPLKKVDFSNIFKKRVIDYFLAEYAKGRTPNPCVMCNKYIKFGELFNYVRRLGFDYLATGHYSRVTAEVKNQKSKIKNTNQNSKIYHLLQARDKLKDQSYFLYNLKQEQLAHILFPVGDLTKKEVRVMAKKMKLPVAQRPESQEICFLPENDYRPFLKRHIAKNIQPGEVVDVKGRVIGRHAGLPLYTIGQRHGFALKSKIKNQKSKLIPPFYVISKNTSKNQLVVGFGQETEKREFIVDQVNLVSTRGRSSSGRNLGEIKNLCVRIRHQGELLKAKLKVKSEKLKVVLDEPQRGIAPGQAAVFYLGEEVLGGGIIN